MKNIIVSLVRWIDRDFSHYSTQPTGTPASNKEIDWVKSFPFIALHLMCFFAFYTGWSPVAVGVAVALYFIRMFAITGAYHRYFSHRSYETSRAFQFFLALLGATSVQKGALWWAAHHRHHHLYSDTPQDLHSPKQQGFWWAHMGWVLSRSSFGTDYKKIPDLAKYPELVFLNRFDVFVPILFAVSIFFFGSYLGNHYPHLGTSGFQMLVWGFFISTVCLAHGTFCINSLTHLIGKVRFRTGDDSRNSLILALVTMGEGWHNNHHFYQASTRQGFYWWEVDITYYILKALASVGLIWKLKPVPPLILQRTIALEKQKIKKEEVLSSR